MAYRKTEKVLAQLEAKRAAIIAASIDVITRGGMAGMTTQAIAARAEVPAGLIYKYFADMNELRAAVIARLAERDVALLRAAENIHSGILIYARAVAANVAALSAVFSEEGYRAPVQTDLARLLRAAGVETPSIMAGVLYGAIFGAARSLTPRNEQALLQALCRAMGLRVRERA